VQAKAINYVKDTDAIHVAAIRSFPAAASSQRAISRLTAAAEIRPNDWSLDYSLEISNYW